MEHTSPSKLLLLSLFLHSFIALSSPTGTDHAPYIIHMDRSAMPSPFLTPESWYMSILSSLSTLTENDVPPPNHLYTYEHVMHGFSAVLSKSQLQQLEKKPGHVSAYPDSYAKLHTTHTPKFLGLNKHAGLWPASKFGDDMIIGILDTGVWPESEMFDDKDMPPVPARWKGICETGTQFNSSHCNRKLIGARSFSKGMKQRGRVISKTDDYDSPRDWYGHGTHTSSTAVGSPVHGVDYFGYAKGTATGIAPMARIAMYKVQFFNYTFESSAADMLAGMDQAIADGVDLMSLSLAFPQTPYYSNVIALGAFAAMERGIFVSCCAGNEGPSGYTIVNGAPWITTVGAGTIDRDFIALIKLGNEVSTIRGQSVFPENIFISNVSLYYGHGNISKESCAPLSLDPKDVAGKIVFCTPNTNISIDDQINEVNRTGPKAAIIPTELKVYDSLGHWDFFTPFVAISLADGEVMKNYITRGAQPPTADITFQITELGARTAPKVADFSSRGPYTISPSILKPDLLAPGFDVLAAWVPNRGYAQIGSNYLITDYALLSGTSMSSPIVVGVAALLQSLHPDWSTAAIRSAMMTTADVFDNKGSPIIDISDEAAATPLDFGAGHINPNKAMDPGLVYDIGLQDYIDFVCGLNYTSNQIGIIIRKSNYTCSGANLDLNYPSFMVILYTNSSSQTFKRVLTNVADTPSVYRAVVKAQAGMSVVVEPQTLYFGGKYSKQEFTLTVGIELSTNVSANGNYIGNYGYLSWYEDGGKHVVTSPIVSAFAA